MSLVLLSHGCMYRRDPPPTHSAPRNGSADANIIIAQFLAVEVWNFGLERT
jgi:hypothetical protein